MTKIIKVPIRNIVVRRDRGRKNFLRIQELSESIKLHGFINPILVTEHPTEKDKYILVAGERRYRGAILAGLTEIPVTFRSELTELEQKILELEENICREELTWHEEAELHRQIDELKRQQNPNWTQAQTAELAQISKGHLSNQIKVAKKLKEKPELLAEIKNLPMNAAMKIIEHRERIERIERLQQQGKLHITTDLRCGDARDKIRDIPNESIDCIITDPPYGIAALEEIRESNSGKFPGHLMMSDHHNQSIEQVLRLMRDLAPQFARVLKPHAHFYIFVAAQYVGEVVNALSPHLEFIAPPLYWLRQRPTVPAYGYNYMSRVETIIYGCKPPRGRRLVKNMYNVFEIDEIPRNARIYPTEKPQELLKILISQSTISNDIVLDPFAGSGGTLKAARELGRRSLGFEIDADSWKLAIDNLCVPNEETLF